MKRIDALEREADRRKEQFELTLEKLRQRLTVRSIAEEAIGALDLNGSGAGLVAAHTIRRNPLLALGLAAGAGWLLLGARKSAHRSKRSGKNQAKQMKEINHGKRNY